MRLEDTRVADGAVAFRAPVAARCGAGDVLRTGTGAAAAALAAGDGPGDCGFLEAARAGDLVDLRVIGSAGERTFAGLLELRGIEVVGV